MKRRTAIKNLAVGAGAMTTLVSPSCAAPTNSAEKNETIENSTLKGNVNHSVCRWCYSKIPLEALIDSAKDMGIQSIEITKPDEWDVKDAGTTMRFLTAYLALKGKDAVITGTERMQQRPHLLDYLQSPRRMPRYQRDSTGASLYTYVAGKYSPEY